MDKIVEFVRARRKELAINQIELSKLSGISLGALRALEQSGKLPKDKKLDKLLVYLGSSLAIMRPESQTAYASASKVAAALLDDSPVPTHALPPAIPVSVPKPENPGIQINRDIQPGSPRMDAIDAHIAKVKAKWAQEAARA